MCLLTVMMFKKDHIERGMHIGEKDGRDPILSFRFLFTVSMRLSCNPPMMSGAVCIFISIFQCGGEWRKREGTRRFVRKDERNFSGEMY